MAADALDTEAHNSTPETDREPRVIIPGGNRVCHLKGNECQAWQE